MEEDHIGPVIPYLVSHQSEYVYFQIQHSLDVSDAAKIKTFINIVF